MNPHRALQMDSLVIYIALLTTYGIVSVEVNMTKAVTAKTTTSATISGNTNEEIGNDSVTNTDGKYKTGAMTVTTYVQHSNDTEEKVSVLGSSNEPTRQATREMSAFRETHLTTLTKTVPTSASTTTSSPLTKFNITSSIGVKTLAISLSSTKHETGVTANIQQSKGSSSASTTLFTKKMSVLRNGTTHALFTNTSSSLASTKVPRQSTKLDIAESTTAESLPNKPSIISTSPTIFSTKSIRPLSTSTSSSIKQSTRFESVKDKVTTQLKTQHESKNLMTTPNTGCLENQTSEIQVSTIKPKVCKTGSCGGAGSCVNALANTLCENGVCTKLVTRRNASYSNYALSCNTTFTNCDDFFTSTATAASCLTCCDTYPCDDYISSPHSATSVVAGDAFFKIVMLMSICFRML